MENKMRIGAILLSLLICASFASCGISDDSGTTTYAPETTPEVSSTPTESVEESLTETTPAVTESETNPSPDSTPTSESEPEPETTPTAETTPADPEGKEITVEEFDTVFREKISSEGGREYIGKIAYFGKIDAGHVFVAHARPYVTWGSESRKIGNYLFAGYSGPDDSRGIFIYDGQYFDGLPNAYDDGKVSDVEMTLIFDWWLEYHIDLDFENTQSEKYDMLGKEKIYDGGGVAAYLVSVSSKIANTDSVGEVLKIGEYEFAKYGENRILYVVYKKSANPSREITAYRDVIGAHVSYDDLAAIHAYWNENCITE